MALAKIWKMRPSISTRQTTPKTLVNRPLPVHSPFRRILTEIQALWQKQLLK